MKRLVLFLLVLTSLSFAQKRPLTVDDLWNMKRIESFDVSPDGKYVVFNILSYSMELNKGNRDIYITEIETGETKAVKNSDKNESSPYFISNDRISYLMDGEIYTCDFKGRKNEKLFELYTGVDAYEWSKDGKQILFTSMIYPECKTQAENKQKDEEKDASKVKASIFTELMYRHWNDWRGDKRSHLFVFDVDTKQYKELTEGSPADTPPIALGSANDINFSTSGGEIAFTMNKDKALAISTNNDVFTINLNDKSYTHNLISEGKGNDNQPVYSPDDKYIAYTSMKRPGFEADKLNLIIYDRQTKTSKNLTEKFGLTVQEFVWSPDSKFIYFITEKEIYKPVYRIEISTGKAEPVYKEHDNSALAISKDGSRLYFKQQRANLPFEIFSCNTDGSGLVQHTNINAKLLSELEMNPAESFWSTGANGVKVQSLMIKPPFFDKNKKYPMVFLIHGGPQGNWSDDFHYRWNTQMFAAQGYVVVAPNPTGSTGYGQKFTDDITMDWGGKPYTDIMNAYDYAIKTFPFIDGKNTFAAGASYGGYMINWIAGHNNKFSALVSHAGVFNLESMYGATEELWFPEWEYGGTPWQNRKHYEKFSPHRYINNAKTPMLVVHGAKDFRVPEGQAFELFSSLQRLGVESKFLYFPDEFHFVTKPQNAKLWWNTIFDWYKKYYKAE